MGARKHGHAIEDLQELYLVARLISVWGAAEM
jgi:hypothetical protein